ncbi:MAG: topoisomerase C-terminal repeat-containing protein [Clostridia bacterium]|nr:topoisomerase C-terminal repeat-containing protein [Clostridia bacterium]
MVLIIAEKPSLGRNIAAGIGGNMKKRDGYLEGDGYIISWAFGHLFSLCDIEAYGTQNDVRQGAAAPMRWTMDNLPCFPEEFRFELRKDTRGKGKAVVDSGVEKQFMTLRMLCHRPDVDAIVNAGDADREGEIIVRLCIQHAAPPKEKRLLRLWLPDQTPETVRKALAEMQEETAYDDLANEGFARTYIDWLYGVNLTRYATLRTGTLLRVGRVIIPIVKAIYDRDMAIRNFVPGKYFGLVSKEETKGEEVELVSKKKFDEDKLHEAEALAAKYNESGAVVTSVKRKKDTLSPGKLYSLSKLQNVLGKKYKMSMKDSLEIIQKLYERGFLTYPRTNSEYLATAEKDKIRKIVGNVAKLGYPVAFREDKTIFDDSKIESHSALTPTYKIPEKSALSEQEALVYGTVFRRFVAVFCSEKCVVSRTEITIRVGGENDFAEDFVLKGTVLLEPGWTKYDDRPQKDKILPNLSKGDAVNINFKPTEKETSPPRHYTIETLNNYLKNPFREEKAAAKEAAENAEPDAEGQDDAEDYRAIFEGLELGTEATRTGIIDNARNSGYIALNKDVYTILPGGEFLIESLAAMQISMDKYKTSEMGKALKKVFRGKMTVKESVSLAEGEIKEIFDKKASGDLSTDSDTGFAFETIGKCPLCGGDVRKIRGFYGCSGYKDGCKFGVSTSICKRAISVANVRLLLENGRTGIIRGFVSKNGKSFDAALKLDENGKATFDFESRDRDRAQKTAPPPAPTCPKCGGRVVKGKTAYGCSNWRDGCDFRIPFISKDGTEVDDAAVVRMLEGIASTQKLSEF